VPRADAEKLKGGLLLDTREGIRRGLDHEKLTYRYSGRDFRLTDVKGNVVKEILA
jgi:hypothetical protein